MEKFFRTTEPDELMIEINIALKEFLGAGSRFNSTAFFGILDSQKKTLEYASAGHDFPLIFSDNSEEIKEIVSTGTLLGIFAESTYGCEKIQFESGDKILFYTDGLIDFFEYELNNEDGYEALKAYLLENRNLSVNEITDSLKKLITSSDTELKDDITFSIITLD